MEPEDADVAAALQAARAAAKTWRETPLRRRLRIIRSARRRIGRDPEAIAATLGDCRPLADTLVAEVLPLVEAARFLERQAAAVLATRTLRRRFRPLWLWGVEAEIRREPLGVVLVLAPSNYPLFLPGAQILQALAAGNAVCVKPAAGGAAPLRALAALLHEAGLPDGAFIVLDDSVATGAAASRAGFDRIVLTGSAATGRQVLAAAAATLTPCTMELSGCDAVYVLPGADLDLVAGALAYGLRLNGGATCIAPRQAYLPAALAGPLEQMLQARIAGFPAHPVPAPVGALLDRLLDEAQAAGARVLARRTEAGVPPIVVADAPPSLPLLRTDIFAPVLALVPVADMEQALAIAQENPYALGASIFGPPAAAMALAARVPAGSVVINDLIVPTADPRLPFGGRKQSGFGVTRGAEGLLEMTAMKTVSLRRGRFRPHLHAPRPGDAARYATMIRFLHGGVLGWARKRARPSPSLPSTGP
ncbi:MAG: aldehyde dehydrogenase family protein [Acidisphaera sp.]|nr:aldehyde dehydrogenase family protein [Acidisphaera sp.]